MSFDTKTGQQLYPVKIKIPPKLGYVVYFYSNNERKLWIQNVLEVTGFRKISDYYELKEECGKGKFGVVKRAKCLLSGQIVAVKEMEKKGMSVGEQLQCRREIEALKMCQDPSFVKLIDIFEDELVIYIVMEYLVGGDLFDYF